MFRKLQAVAALMCMLSYAAAGTVSIGTASARGDMRVDSYMVKGNATLFDGSVVETGQATADLRLDKGAAITMSTNSRGTLYRDRLVLQRGESELAASSPFKLEANGLRVTPNETNSRGVVSLAAGNTVEVAALNGSFGVTNVQGILLANVRPGSVVSFAMQAAGASPTTSFSGVGLVSYEDGHYYLTDSANVKYEITGKDFKQYVGTKVVISGTIQAPAAEGTPSVISVSSIGINGPTGMSMTTKLIIGGVVVGAAVGIGVGIAVSNSSKPPASP
ncbi:MAG: hypothetical protein ABSG60_14505 [Terracidiphilus sp.]|jgi:hypothetical protein